MELGNDLRAEVRAEAGCGGSREIKRKRSQHDSDCKALQMTNENCGVGGGLLVLLLDLVIVIVIVIVLLLLLLVVVVVVVAGGGGGGGGGCAG